MCIIKLDGGILVTGNVSIHPSTSKLIGKLWSHLTRRRQKQFWLLLVLMVIASFAEMVSIGATLPFLGALTAPEQKYDTT